MTCPTTARSTVHRESAGATAICGLVREAQPQHFPGQRGVVSSMGNDALILEGVESAKAAWSFYSTAHCAGRLFGRKDAKRQL